MSESTFEYGVIGLGTMGLNLALNIMDHGHTIAGYDKDQDKVVSFDKGTGREATGVRTITEFVQSLNVPRVIILLVPAGAIVDAVIEELKVLLADNDLIIDLGNSHYTDTERRIRGLDKSNIRFIGMGISGGEWGARHGPSIMPGGRPEDYEMVAPMLQDISAKVNGEPCVTLLGPGAAGHYVKMLHNGIEYGIMQIISESYHLLKQLGGCDNKELHAIYSKWNEGKLQSYLIEITAKIFDWKDDLSGDDLVDKILDTARQKGTGGWASEDAMELQVPLSVINAGVIGRDLSAYKKEREVAQGILKGPEITYAGEQGALVKWMEEAVYFAMITAYAEGMALLRAASAKYKFGLNLEEVAKIWRGGCIIRSSFLEQIKAAFATQPDLPNIMINTSIAAALIDSQKGIRKVIGLAVENGIPLPAMMAALSYYDSYRCAKLPANLVQAQRDYFGAHTYERLDRSGVFHTHWE
jgi:6-phosphogluconate dehydrogenase